MEKPKRRLGKRAEPKEPELLFIFQRMWDGMDNSQVLSDLEYEGIFPPRELPFVERRRREFEAARKVIENKLRQEGIHDPVLLERKRIHWQAMTNSADGIANAWGQYASFGRASMPGILEDGRCSVDSADAGCLLNHLKAEHPAAFGQFKTWQEMFCTDSMEVIRLVQLAAKRGVFLGSCDVCLGLYQGDSVVRLPFHDQIKEDDDE